MNLKLKDRVKLKNGDKKVKGTIVKMFYGNRSNDIRTCAILWDNEWPRDGYRKPRLFYVKPADLVKVGTWSLK